MNATDLVIAPPGRLFARTSPRVRRIDRLNRPNLPPDLVNPTSQADESISCACGLVLGGSAGPIYNEEAFQHFLSIERKRAQVWGTPLLLALVDLTQLDAAGAGRGAESRHELFSALRTCLRETDFVGWYRHDDLVGAALPLFRGSLVNTSTRRVGQRLSEGLAERLPTDQANSIEIHVYEVTSADRD